MAFTVVDLIYKLEEYAQKGKGGLNVLIDGYHIDHVTLSNCNFNPDDPDSCDVTTEAVMLNSEEAF